MHYHLLILGSNHRIAAYRADKKYVRYFAGPAFYSADEQAIMSIVRRDVLRRTLQALVNRPGLSNLELAKEPGLPESVMSRHLKELLEKGVIVRDDTAGGRYAYSISSEYRVKVASAIERIGDE